MDHYFVDSSFLIARFNPRDTNHARARSVLQGEDRSAHPPMSWVYSDYIFDETVTTTLALAKRWDSANKIGDALRGSKLLRMARVDESVFEAAWELFCERADKQWSFTDCTSFILMEHLGIRKALTFDRNFQEAGYAMMP